MRLTLRGARLVDADIDVFNKIARSVDDGKYPHVARWFAHINSFSSCQRKRWGGTAADSKEEKKGAAAAKPAAAAKKEAVPEPEEEEEAELDFDSLGDDAGADDSAVQKILKSKEAEKPAKSEKKAPVAKSTVILDVKPQGSETDMKELEKQVRGITQEGLVWGGSELVPVAYGVKKLRIIAIVEDEKVSVDDLQESIEKFEECQSTDIHAFNKV